MTLPVLSIPTVIALLAIGAIVGALTFSLIIGRRRARQLARLADHLARAGVASHDSPGLRYPDRVLTVSLERLAERIAEVEELASTDPLTGLINRLACLQLLESEIERANRYQRPLAVAIIDIDHFKRVNDTHGHAVGDEALRHVAAVLRANVRNIDTLGRYGGEEFLLVMPETDVDGGLASAEHLRRILAGTDLQLGGQQASMTISAGIAGGNGAASLDTDQLLRESDVALYSAKALGRDQVQAFRAVDEKGGVMRATIELDARRSATTLGRKAFEASHDHLLNALMDRPGWAGGASQLIAEISRDMARAIGLPDGDVERIRTASLLHDLGKLAIPDSILSKPSALNAAEWRSIVEHPKIGQVVLEQAGAISDAAAIVLHHHEWFDGHGYPYGLAGGEIPIGSRIVAIADAYEAMISDRPYKVTLSHAEALAELKRASGSQFDPELVNLFISLFGSRPHGRSTEIVEAPGPAASAATPPA